ncbi:MAG: septum site-determining protein MinC [Bacillota bacterium]
MRQDIVIRGTTKTGLLLLLPDEMEFPVLCQRLKERLSQSGRFFAGAGVAAHVGQRSLTETEQATLAQILREAEMTLLKVVEGGDPVAEAHAAAKAAEEARRTHALPAAGLVPSETALVVTKTLRSGQEVRHQGDVIILGDVNPGAVVIASGHIVVMGALRGVAHAGCTGNTEAIVAAAKLRPTQLRIAHVIGRSPDEDTPQSVPEVARVKGDLIVVEASSEKR